MSRLPLRRLLISDFRRLEGTREIPLDAPVVLIHGPNGTGKTSVLSALELALTGEIRSMERQSDRYPAYLPSLGRSYATVRAEVAEDLRSNAPTLPLTVNGGRLEGTPALGAVAAKFFSERCYLDQSSLGRLLDLYQMREDGEQSALEQFVNELLGLEKLDALRDGLRDATDFRYLKKLALGADEADGQAKRSAAALHDETASLAEIRRETTDARRATSDALVAIGLDASTESSEPELLSLAASALDEDALRIETIAAEAIHQEVVALGGRISATVVQPSTSRVEETRTSLRKAREERDAWATSDASKVQAWEARAQAAGLDPTMGARDALKRALDMLDKENEAAANLQERYEAIVAQLVPERAALERVVKDLSNAHEHSSALVEGLAAMRVVVAATNICPVCDRDFGELKLQTLGEHVETKLGEFQSHGERLVEARTARDETAARVAHLDRAQTQLSSQLSTSEERQSRDERAAVLATLASEIEDVEALKWAGTRLDRLIRELESLLEDQEFAASELTTVSREIDRLARVLGETVAAEPEQVETRFAVLLRASAARVADVEARLQHHREARLAASRLSISLERERDAVQRLTGAAEEKRLWDNRLAESKGRQRVARAVRDAAIEARARIVQRVFTESLNDVWATVFSRLAPNEGFIPSFGTPTATKKSFDINLQTTHRGGDAGGPPQMMLSAGNLNTAALSLFLALHLAVEPAVPCLVFDDPVQAMDEVHVAQFAGLIRVLAKQNHRQIVIAVHERELFEYLSLELSPAYEGDALITVELGDRSLDDDGGINRLEWAPDTALAS